MVHMTTLSVGLPFNIFPVKDVDDLFECMLKQLSPSGHLVYFAYMGMTKLKWPFIVFQPRLRKSLLERRKLMHQIHSHCGATRSMVLRNLPPAWACSLSALPHQISQPQLTHGRVFVSVVLFYAL